MALYHVHYEISTLTGFSKEQAVIRMIAPIEARSEREAIAHCKATRNGSFGHRVNRLADEIV